MNCWEFLNIEATSNKRAIKKAYAILLKQHKPDEQPEAFQQLHDAYKEALYWSDIIAEEEHDETPDIDPKLKSDSFEFKVNDDFNDETNQVFDIESRVNDNAEYNTNSAEHSENEFLLNENLDEYDNYTELEEDLLDTEDKKLLEQLISQIDSKISNKQFPTPNKLEFLKSETRLLDWDFNNRLSVAVLELMANSLNGKSKKHNLNNRIPTHTLHFFNEIFSWDSNPYILFNYFDHDTANIILDRLDSKQKQKTLESVKGGNRVKSFHEETFKAEKFERFFATVIDGVILFFLYLGVTQIISLEAYSPPIVLGLYSFISYGILSIAFESSSKFQATPGKMLFKLKVVDAQMQPLSIKKAFTRFLCLSLNVSLFTYALIILKGKGFILVFILFWVLGLMGFNLLRHDQLSKTQVIRVKRFGA